MSRFTKKYMTEDYERLRNHSDLLEMYLNDTQMNRTPDAVERYKDKNCECRVQLWRATGANGGYVVIQEAMANIWLLDEAIKIFGQRSDPYSLGIRICLERLQVARYRLNQKEASHA